MSNSFTSTPLYFAGTMKEMQLLPTDACNEFVEIHHNLGEIVKISCTDASCFILTSTGEVFSPAASHPMRESWKVENNPTFVRIQDVSDVYDLTTGSVSSFFFQRNHEIRASNFAKEGLVVHDSHQFTDRLDTSKFIGLTGRIIQIAATSSNALFLGSTRRQLYSVGFGGTSGVDKSLEGLFETHENLTITDMSSGAVHVLVLLSDGRVVAFGDDSNGQLGGVSSGSMFDFKEPVKSIYAGSYHSFFVLPSGIYTCGYSGDYRLGFMDSRLSPPKRIEIFDTMSCSIPHIIGRVSTMFVVDTNGHWDLYFIGDNERGEAGIKDESTNPRRPIQVGSAELSKLLNDRKRYIFNYTGGYYFRFFYFTRNLTFSLIPFFSKLWKAQENEHYTDIDIMCKW